MRSGKEFGGLLREWRQHRKLSQIALAGDADTTARYLSFLETGRAHPTVEMVLRLCEALEIPDRERNALFIAAGFAARYRETGLAHSEMDQLRGLLQDLLDDQSPYPAVVTDRYLNILATNLASQRSAAQFFNPAKLWPDGQRNAMDVWLSPLGYRPHLENWDEVVRVLLTMAHERGLTAPADSAGQRHFERWLDYPGVRELWAPPEPGAKAPLVCAPRLRRSDLQLDLHLVICTLGSPQDAMHKEVRITFFRPANDTMKRFYQWLQKTGGSKSFAAFKRAIPKLGIAAR